LRLLHSQRERQVVLFQNVINAGYQIDSIIRQHLWAGGFDYPGVTTGHGVTHGLGVVEGGATISSLKPSDQVGLREGMIMTIGLYH